MSIPKPCKEPNREVLKKHSVCIVGLHQGFGQRSELLEEGSSKDSFAEDILYFMIIGLVKFSILGFY